MGFVKKTNTVADPARKNGTIFQDQYTYQSGTTPIYRKETRYRNQYGLAIGAIYGVLRISTNFPIAVTLKYRRTYTPNVWESVSVPACYKSPDWVFDVATINTQSIAEWNLVLPAGWTKVGTFEAVKNDEAYVVNVLDHNEPIYSTAWHTKWSKR